MRKKKNQNEKVIQALNSIQKSNQTMAKNTELTNQKLDIIQSNTQITAQHMGSADEKLNDIQKSTKSKLPIILTIIGLIITASGVSVRGIYNNYKEQHKEDEQHEIYLYSEYSKVTIGVETNITATLNFDTDSVTITAYLASGKTDTLAMQQKNNTEWQKRVYFDEIGIHTIVVTAVDPDGNLVEDTIEVEVVPIGINDIK